MKTYSLCVPLTPPCPPHPLAIRPDQVFLCTHRASLQPKPKTPCRSRTTSSVCISVLVCRLLYTSTLNADAVFTARHGGEEWARMTIIHLWGVYWADDRYSSPVMTWLKTHFLPSVVEESLPLQLWRRSQVGLGPTPSCYEAVTLFWPIIPHTYRCGFPCCHLLAINLQLQPDYVSV